MAYQEKQPEGFSVFKFWILFVLGLVVVLILFRGFSGAGENTQTPRRYQQQRSQRSTVNKRDHTVF